MAKRSVDNDYPTRNRTHLGNGYSAEKLFRGIVGKDRTVVWPGGVMAKTLACDSRGREFNSRPCRCQVTTLDKLFTHMCLCHQAV